MSGYLQLCHGIGAWDRLFRENLSNETIAVRQSYVVLTHWQFHHGKLPGKRHHFWTCPQVGSERMFEHCATTEFDLSTKQFATPLDEHAADQFLPKASLGIHVQTIEMKPTALIGARGTQN